MPPSAKYTKQEVLNAALGILRSEGKEALTARHLGEVLGGSSRPIFTLFSSMQEVQEGAVALAKQLYTEYLDKGLEQVPPFKGVGMSHIKFAADEPQLFRLIFAHPENAGWGGPGMYMQSAANYERILGALVQFYGISVMAARSLYEHMWLYTHGIASLIASGVIEPDMEKISRQLTEVFSSLLPRYRTGELS